MNALGWYLCGVGTGLYLVFIIFMCWLGDSGTGPK